MFSLVFFKDGSDLRGFNLTALSAKYLLVWFISAMKTLIFCLIHMSKKTEENEQTKEKNLHLIL